MTHLSRLIAHLEWADGRTLKALRAASALDPATLELYAHILGAEATWLARLDSRAPAVAVWPSLTLDQCEALAAENARGFKAYLERPSAPDLTHGITYRNSAGDEFTSTVEDILLHVAMHGAYHRGQVARALRQAGAVPEPTDYIAFTRGAAAATRR
ncbi:MAG: DinB family protein [Gemmatimonadales bacterium]